MNGAVPSYPSTTCSAQQNSKMNDAAYADRVTVHTLRTRFAPRRKPCADTARLSIEGRKHDPISQLAHTAARARRWGATLAQSPPRSQPLCRNRSRADIRNYEPVLSCSWSSLSPRSATFVMFSRMMPTVSSICCWIAAVFELPAPAGFEEEPPRGR